MPFLPNVELARVEDSKLHGYLLSLSHPEGGAKARFYKSVGFTIDNDEELRIELLRIARTFDVVEISADEFGVKYAVEGILIDKQDRGIPLLTVWVIDKGTDFPRLVTAYPL
jgi:hypothetical protein